MLSKYIKLCYDCDKVPNLNIEGEETLRSGSIFEMTDIQELVRLSRQDAHYLVELWEKLEGTRERCFNKFSNIKEDKEDLHQQAYFVFERSVRTYDEEKVACFKTYFTNNLINELISCTRYQVGKGRMDLLEEAEMYKVTHQASGEKSLEEQVLLSAHMKQLQAILTTLSEEEYALFKYIYLQGMSLKSLSEKTGVHYKTLHKRKQKVLKEIREKWETFEKHCV